MSQNHHLRAAAVAFLLLVFITTGIVGGIDFAPDVAAIRWLEDVRAQSPALTKLAVVLTQAGSVYATFGGGLLIAALLAWRRRVQIAAILATTVFGERLIVDGLKLMIDRTRPSFDLHPVVTHSSSFPSGHAGNSMAVFLTIALLAPTRYRGVAVVLAIVASMIVGLTRPYLGVHWPSDIIGGWALGAAIAITAWTFAERGPRASQATRTIQSAPPSTS